MTAPAIPANRGVCPIRRGYYRHLSPYRWANSLVRRPYPEPSPGRRLHSTSTIPASWFVA